MATTEVETVSSGADKAKLAGSVLLCWAALLPTTAVRAGRPGAVGWRCSRPGVRRWACSRSPTPASVWWPLARILPKRSRKVVWPARREAMQMTAYVFAFVFVMALFLWLTDKTLEWVFYDLVLGWR
jgi:preprotein translocase subunit SecE